MGGFRFLNQVGGKTTAPKRIDGLMPYSANGASTVNTGAASTSGQIYAGDVLVQTTAATWTGGTIPVCRQLSYTDQYVSGPHYYTSDHSTGSIAGVYGVAVSTEASNSTAQHIAPAVLNAANIPYPYSTASLYQNDAATGKGILPVYDANSNTFAGRFYGGTTRTVAALLALPGQLGAITLILGTGANGVPVGVVGYFLDVIGASTTPQFTGIVRFGKWLTDDPVYSSTIGLAGATNGWVGSVAPLPATPEISFEFVSTYCQTLNGVIYSV